MISSSHCTDSHHSGRRRKVRCNEQKPRCSHCERLNLQCTWRPLPVAVNPTRRQSSAHSEGVAPGLCRGNPINNDTNTLEPSILNAPNQSASEGTFNELFDYASFMWDNEIQSRTIQPNCWRDVEFPDMELLAPENGDVSSQLLHCRLFCLF